MNRRTMLNVSAGTIAAAALPIPAPARPSANAWQTLRERVGGNLVALTSPFSDCQRDPSGAACTELFRQLTNPFYVGNHPELTETLGWTDAWTSQTSAYAVVARNAADVAAAVDFARDHGIKLVVKGGGHSYLGTSNAANSLLVWTRRMDGVGLEDDTVRLGSGAIWMLAYDAVTTHGGRYVQGGGCTTVGVAGLVQSGGFGSFSKHYGTAASGLIEAEIVTADGRLRVVNASSDPDLHWALKGGGGGTFGVVTRLTLKTHALPEFFGGANFSVEAASDDLYRELVARFAEFYRTSLFNDHWGEQVGFGPHNHVIVSMVFYDLDSDQANAVWLPFLDWVKSRPRDFKLSDPIIGNVPAQRWWDRAFIEQHYPEAIVPNTLPGASPADFWWKGDGDQVAQYLYGYESLWMPAALLQSPETLAAALYDASRVHGFNLHCNKGLAGAPSEAIAAALQTATNPAVTRAFALAICADAQSPVYPGIPGHEPDDAAGRASARRIHACVDKLRLIAGEDGAYLSESNYFQDDWQRAYWGENYERLLITKRRYDPQNLFSVHHGVGSDS
jgi:FAD/FMN-containing dehydrogenase